MVQTQQATSSESNSEQIAAAIAQVSVSQQDLRSASSSLTQATSKLPVEQGNVSLTGNWADQYGTIYAIRQKGSSFGYQAAFRNRATLGGGGDGRAEGKVDGRNLSYVYTDRAGNRYLCTAVVAPDSQRIDETCKTKDGQVLTVGMVRS